MTNGYVGPAKKHYVENGTGVTYIQGYNVTDGGINLHGIKRVSLAFHTQHQKSCLRSGDLLTVQTGEVGLTTIVPPALAGSNCHALIISRFKRVRIDPRFVMRLFNSDGGRQALRSIETGSTMKHLNVGDMLDFQIPVPSLREQKAIADAIDDISGVVQSLELLIAKKKAIKDGMMQQLVTGKERLPGFAEPWSSVRLNDLLDYEQPGRYLVQSSKQLESGRVPVLTAGKTFVLGYTTRQVVYIERTRQLSLTTLQRHQSMSTLISRQSPPQ
jgi:type I restriction enzyme S subunit